MFENSSSKTASEFNVDTSISKLVGIGVVNVLAAAFLGYALKSVIADGGLTAGNILAVVGGNILFLSLFLLQALFIKSFKIQSLLALLETVALSGFFLPFLSWTLLFAIFLLFLFLLNAIRRGMKEIDNQIKIQFFPIEKHTLPTAITALSLFVSIVYLAMNGSGASFLSKSAVHSLLKPAEPLIQSLLIKDFSIDMAVSSFAEVMAAKQFGTAFTALPAAEKSQALTSIIKQLQAQAASYGVAFKQTDTINDVFYEYFAKQFNNIPDNYRSLIPYALFLLTFLTVKSLGSLLRWLVSVPAYVLYQFLLSVGFIRIGVESRSREIIILG